MSLLKFRLKAANFIRTIWVLILPLCQVLLQTKVSVILHKSIILLHAGGGVFTKVTVQGRSGWVIRGVNQGGMPRSPSVKGCGEDVIGTYEDVNDNHELIKWLLREPGCE